MRPEKSILSEPINNIEPSAAVRKRVIAARQIQIQRAGKANALLGSGELARFCPIDGHRLQLLETAAEQLFLSPRACHRILKVARTIADMDETDSIRLAHIAEAIAFRQFNSDQNYI